MFALGDNLPTPCLNKVALATARACFDGNPLPQLRETDPTSLVFPGSDEFWMDAPSTFTVGKLDPLCASSQFSEELPKLPESLLKAEFETRTKLARSLSSGCLTEATAVSGSDEPFFQVLAKSFLATFQLDLHEFVMARLECRKFIFADATIRHEPNKLIKSSIWGPNLFPEGEVTSVMSEATRANQSLRARWGIPTYKRKTPESAGPQTRGGKRFRRHKRPHQAMVQAVPVSAVAQPSTSKSQPQQYVLVQPAAPSYVSSPAYNPTYEGRGFFHGLNRVARGGRGKAPYRGKSNTTPRGRGRGRGNKPAPSH